jgi:hypothetical protein
MRIAFLGVGNVGAPLADRLQRLGHAVTIAARDPDSNSVRQALARNPSLGVSAPAAAVREAEVVVLATPFAAVEAVLPPLAAELAGKVLIDCTNPLAPGFRHGLESRTSGAEEVQRLAPGAKVVKAFSTYGHENFQDSAYPGYGALRPAMPLAGDDAEAKATVAGLCRELGWEPVDTGPLALSLQLEHMAILWIQMARVGGRGAGFAWALLRR